MRLTLSLVPVLLSAAAVAQVTPHERALIKGLTGAWANGKITYSVARDGKRMQQQWVRGDQMPTPFLILEFGERVEIGSSPALSYQMTAIFDNVSYGFTALNADPTKNRTANAVTVFNMMINFPALSGTHPNQVHAWCKLARPFVFTGPHFFIEKTWDPGTVTTGTRLKDYFSIAAGIRSRHLTAGTSCGGATLGASYSSTGTYSANLTGAPANVLALFMIAIENVVLGGSVPLPIDLAVIGMAGCELGVDPLVFLPLQTNASGTASLTAPFPFPTTDTAVWSIQVLHQATSGFATSNVVNSFIGETGLVNNLRVDKRGQKGPDGFNSSGAVVLLRGR